MIDFGQINRPKTETEILQESPVAVTQEVTVSKAPIADSAYLLKQREHWTWSDLRDYVVTEATRRFGPQIRNPQKEAGIFKGFISRHGIADAVSVAQAAFEIYEGTWRSAPITVSRFTKGNDPYFAEVILARLKG